MMLWFRSFSDDLGWLVIIERVCGFALGPIV